MYRKLFLPAVVVVALLVFGLAGTLFVNWASANPVVPGAFWGIPNAPKVTIAYPRNGSVLASTDYTLNFNVPELSQFTYETVTANIRSIRYRVEAENSYGLGWSLYVDGDVAPEAGFSDAALSLPDGNFSVTVTAVWGGMYQPRGTFGYAEGFSVENSANVCFVVDTQPPDLTVLSPLNENYTETDIPLHVLVSEPVSELAYSIDGQAKVNITGNRTVAGLPIGTHSLVVYATDMAGNEASKTVQFSVIPETEQAEPELQPSEPFPTELAITASGASVAAASVVLLVYFKKHKRG